MARHLLDVKRREVTVAFAEDLEVLAEGIGNPLRQSHADHRLPGGVNWDVHVVDLLAKGFRKPGRHVMK